MAAVVVMWTRMDHPVPPQLVEVIKTLTDHQVLLLLAYPALFRHHRLFQLPLQPAILMDLQVPRLFNKTVRLQGASSIQETVSKADR